MGGLLLIMMSSSLMFTRVGDRLRCMRERVGDRLRCMRERQAAVANTRWAVSSLAYQPIALGQTHGNNRRRVGAELRARASARHPLLVCAGPYTRLSRISLV